MTDEQKRKDSFVRHELRFLVRAIDKDITDISYTVTDVGEEEVTVTWHNGYKRRINVTGDSFKAIVWDVLRRI
ncbi:MAG: hypothetical protein IJ779_03500 [Ruminococcus sp.]|nr:hypothetical protein [Ruminococcus sp.]